MALGENLPFPPTPGNKIGISSLSLVPEIVGACWIAENSFFPSLSFPLQLVSLITSNAPPPSFPFLLDCASAGLCHRFSDRNSPRKIRDRPCVMWRERESTKKPPIRNRRGNCAMGCHKSNGGFGLGHERDFGIDAALL